MFPLIRTVLNRDYIMGGLFVYWGTSQLIKGLKPLVAVKPGNSEAGISAITSSAASAPSFSARGVCFVGFRFRV